MSSDFWNQIKVQPNNSKKHTVTISGTTMEVDLATKIEIQTLGEHRFMLDKGKIMRKPVKLSQGVVYPRWQPTNNGYDFVDGHMFWPSNRITNGKNFSYD